jgi:hypothetical protein
MKTSTTSALLPCMPETFWAVFLDESYLKALYLEELQYQAFAVIEIDETSRKLRIVPKMRLPAPVARLIGENFAYEEHGTLDRARNQWTWRMVQPANLDPTSKPRKDVVTMHGTVRVQAAGDGHCRRTDDFSIEAKMFGLGGLVESSVEKELRSARAKECVFLKRWVEEGGA